MSYFDDYGDSKKIPYDDIPITRNERTSRGSGGFGKNLRTGKFSTMIISFMIVLNLVLSIVCIYFVKNTKNRTIYNNVYDIPAGTEVSSAVKISAFESSIAVAAGSSCSSEYEFYNSMKSRGSGVIYKVARKSSDPEEAAYNKGIIYFATCYHVVSGYVNTGGNSVWIMLPTGRKPLPVKVLAFSAHYDIAVLKYETNDIEKTLSGSKPVTVFDSVYTSLGEKIFAIGNPLSSGLSITEGLVSQVNAEIKVGTNSYYTRTLQISAEINPGNSGGGLFNSNGEFLGIVQAKRHSGTSDDQQFTVVGMSYAIPSSIVCGIVDSLISGDSKPKRVSLGVTFAHDESLASPFRNYEYNNRNCLIQQSTVIVEDVEGGSVADGLLKINDRIESIEFYLVGENEPRRVPMFNKFIFDDYSFRIKEHSEIRFYLYDGKEVSTTFKSITLGASESEYD